MLFLLLIVQPLEYGKYTKKSPTSTLRPHNLFNNPIYTTCIRVLYGLYTTSIRVVYGLYTTFIRFVYGFYTTLYGLFEL